MTEYLGRYGACTAGTKYPDHNLTAYAKEHGFETALLGVVFDSGGAPRKIYSYWGHTGVKRNHYLKVLVPRGNSQEEVFVKVMSVLPATGIKENSIVTAKHMLKNTGARKTTEGTAYIRCATPALIERWRNEMCRDLLPMPKTEHAKSAVSEIDGMLSDDRAMDFKLPPGYYAILEHKPLEEVRKMFQQDFNPLEQRITAEEGKQFREYLRETWLERQLARHKAVTPKARPLQSFIDEVDFPLHQTTTGRITGQNLPSNLPKENTVSAKVETVTYVTLPSGSRRDASTLKPEEFFDAIALLEREVKKLDGIERKPRALQERMADLESQIDQLASLCDSLHAKKEEPASDLAKTTYRDGSVKSQSGAALGSTQTYSATGSGDVGQDGSDRA